MTIPLSLDEAIAAGGTTYRPTQCGVCIALRSLGELDRARLDDMYAKGELVGAAFTRVLALMGHKVAKDSPRTHYRNGHTIS